MAPSENLDEEDLAVGSETDETEEAVASEAQPDPGVSELSDAPDPDDKLAAKSTAFMGVPIEVVVSVGKARPPVSDLVKLRRDSVISLDSKIDDPVEIYIGDRLIARGELQEIEDEEGRLGVRLTEVADLSNGV